MSAPRTIGAVTVARSDFGILLPVLRAIEAAPDLRLRLFVSGMHLAPHFGHTVREVEREGFEHVERVPMLLADDSPEAVSVSVGVGVSAFARAFARQRPDVLLVLGDRFEMLTPVVASLPFTIPVAHIHGGETTEGAMDEAIRHAITKMSHLHFVTTEPYARRVVQLGEDPARVVVSGAPGLDHLGGFRPLAKETLSERVGMPLDPAPLLVTFHPVTFEQDQTERYIGELLDALDASGHPVVFTYPNADPSGSLIIEAIDAFAGARDHVVAVQNLGTEAYLSLMGRCAAMVGNTSSGIIEAASFELPVVNVGNRQRGRVAGRNVIHTGYSSAEIATAIGQATEPGFRDGLRGMANPYGDGRATERIVERLRSQRLDSSVLAKPFHDLHTAP